MPGEEGRPSEEEYWKEPVPNCSPLFIAAETRRRKVQLAEGPAPSLRQDWIAWKSLGGGVLW